MATFKTDSHLAIIRFQWGRRPFSSSGRRAPMETQTIAVPRYPNRPINICKHRPQINLLRSSRRICTRTFNRCTCYITPLGVLTCFLPDARFVTRKFWMWGRGLSSDKVVKCVSTKSSGWVFSCSLYRWGDSML